MPYRSHECAYDSLRQKAYKLVPVDSCIAAESVYGILRELLLKASDSHGHVSADRREHASKQICENLEHGKPFDFMRAALSKQISNTKLTEKKLNCIFWVLRFIHYL